VARTSSLANFHEAFGGSEKNNFSQQRAFGSSVAALLLEKNRLQCCEAPGENLFQSMHRRSAARSRHCNIANTAL
jgi:hypothetical protein